MPKESVCVERIGSGTLARSLMAELTRDFFIEAGRRGGQKSASIRWRSTIDPSLESTKAGLARLHRSRGLPVEAREKVIELS